MQTLSTAQRTALCFRIDSFFCIYYIEVIELLKTWLRGSLVGFLVYTDSMNGFANNPTNKRREQNNI